MTRHLCLQPGGAKVLVLKNALSHMLTKDALDLALAKLARRLRPGGLLLVPRQGDRGAYVQNVWMARHSF